MVCRKLLVCLFFLCFASVAHAAQQTILPQDIDWANTASWHNGTTTPPPRETVLCSLGLPGAHVSRRWRGSLAGASDHEAGAHVVQYRLAFIRPVRLGAVLAEANELAVLKNDDAFPGNPEAPEDWEIVGRQDGAPVLRLHTFAKPVTTRALLLTVHGKPGRYFSSRLRVLRLFDERVFNVAGLARVRANHEDSQTTLSLIRGSGAWVSHDPDDNGRIPVPRISDVDPAFLILAWQKPVTLSGLYMEHNFSRFQLQVPEKSTQGDLLLADALLWETIHEGKADASAISFNQPITTRALRIQILKTWEEKDRRRIDSRQAKVQALILMQNLKDAPIPTSTEEVSPPPYAVPYSIEKDGYVTLAIDDEKGRRVRNLVARVMRKGGQQNEHWDLRDDAGKWVAPGTYRIRGITHPPLTLTYETTVYPNTSQLHSENAPWLTGHSGSGSWLADHSAPFDVATSGDTIVFGSPVPESGTGLVVSDLSGKRLWGVHSFGGFTGPRHMAMDGQYVYAEKYGAFKYKGAQKGDRVWQLDTETREIRQVLAVPDSETRKRGISGMAAAGGKLYLSVRAKENWLISPTGAATVDLANCMPLYPPARKPRRPYEVVPNPQNDFLRLFRLHGTPPGYARDHGLTWLHSTKGPEGRQHILLAFKKPVAIGSVVYPAPQEEGYTTSVSVLKPDAPYPPDPLDKRQWIPFSAKAGLPWNVIPAPEDTRTRALLITFKTASETEELDDLAQEVSLDGDDGLRMDAEHAAPAGPAWEGRLEGMQLLRRRYENVASNAKVRVSSGKVNSEGVWIAKRKTPLSASDPATYVMEWKTPQTLRGLAIREVDGKETEVDVWVGDNEGSIPLRGQSGWKTVARFTSRRRTRHVNFSSHNALARYLETNVDFGEEITTRAVRLRVVSQWTKETREGSCAAGGLDLDVTRCRIFGVAALNYLGGEAPVDMLMCERIEVVSPESKAIEREIPIKAPGELAVNNVGALHAISGNAVVKVSDDGKHAPIITDLLQPTAFCFDADGNLYAFDNAPARKTIRVYGKDGSFLREIGKPGGYRVGPWNPKRLQHITGLAVDKENKLWAADSTAYPKRVSCWTREGEFLREYLGPTAYGGAGVLDPQEPTRLVIGPLEFTVDRSSGKSHLKNILADTFSPGKEAGGMDKGILGEVPLRANGQLYFVNRPSFSRNTLSCGVVYRYDTDRLTPVAAMGIAAAFPPLQDTAFSQRIAKKGGSHETLEFLWSDKNDNGNVDPEEVELYPLIYRALGQFAQDLSICSGTARYRVTSFTAKGAPVYRRETFSGALADALDGRIPYRLSSGDYYVMGNGEEERWVRKDGSILASYPSAASGVHALMEAGKYREGQVICQFYPVGHAVASGGDLGEFLVVNSNLGSWNIWTADGLLAGRVFEDFRNPKHLRWSMQAHNRGMALSGITAGQEHFQGWFCKEKSGRYTAVAGHNHASIVTVDGLDRFRRFGGKLTVTQADLQKAAAWEEDAARHATAQTVQVVEAPFFNKPPNLDGKLDEWGDIPAVTLKETGRTVRLAWDKQFLYLAAEMEECGPLLNTGDRWDILFKTGGALDLHLGVNALAALDRKMPVEGDKRILVTRQKGKPAAVLYDAIVPGTDENSVWRAQSPVGETVFDRVQRIPIQLGYQEIQDDDGTVRAYTAEIRIPLSALGLSVTPKTKCKIDLGVLETTNAGNVVRRRLYWANPLTQILADTPSEARLHPDLWGWVVFTGSSDIAPVKGLLESEPAEEEVEDIDLLLDGE